MPNWYELYCSCPVCYSGGNCSRTDRTYWKHSNCSGWIEISEDIDLRCDKCLNPSYILNWQFYCAKHGKYEGLGIMELRRCLAILCDNTKIPNDVLGKMFEKIK